MAYSLSGPMDDGTWQVMGDGGKVIKQGLSKEAAQDMVNQSVEQEGVKAQVRQQADETRASLASAAVKPAQTQTQTQTQTQQPKAPGPGEKTLKQIRTDNPAQASKAAGKSFTLAASNGSQWKFDLVNGDGQAETSVYKYTKVSGGQQPQGQQPQGQQPQGQQQGQQQLDPRIKQGTDESGKPYWYIQGNKFRRYYSPESAMSALKGSTPQGGATATATNAKANADPDAYKDRLIPITSDMTSMQQAEADKYNNAVIAAQEQQYKQNQAAAAKETNAANKLAGRNMREQLKSENPISKEALERNTQTMVAMGRIPDGAKPIGTGKGDYGIMGDGQQHKIGGKMYTLAEGKAYVLEPEKGFAPRQAQTYKTINAVRRAFDLPALSAQRAEGDRDSDSRLKNIISAINRRF